MKKPEKQKQENIYPVNLTIKHEIKDDHGMCHSQKGLRINIDINSNDYHPQDVHEAVEKAFEEILAKFY